MTVLLLVLEILVLVGLIGLLCYLFNPQWFIKIEPGDVLLRKYYTRNPYEDYEWKYETVIDVKKNKYGVQYFMSYTSNKDGERATEQNKYIDSHSKGDEFDPELFIIVKHNVCIDYESEGTGSHTA